MYKIGDVVKTKFTHKVGIITHIDNPINYIQNVTILLVNGKLIGTHSDMLKPTGINLQANLLCLLELVKVGELYD